MWHVPESEAQYGVFTLAQAMSAGWTRGTLTRALAAGQLIRLRRGVFIDGDRLPEPHPDSVIDRLRIRSAAAVLGASGAAASHSSAAALAGLPLLEPDEVPYVTVDSGRHSTLVGVRVHRASLARPGHMARGVGPIARTSSARTSLDLARECGLESGLVAADAALRQQRTTPSELAQVARECAGWPMVQNAVQVARLATRLSESALESISRLAIAEAGVEQPDLQVNVLDDQGRWLARVDFLWRRRGVVGEADGLSKYTRTDVLREEKLRQERLEQAGLVIVRWGWADVRAPIALGQRLERAFEQAELRSSANRRWRTSPSSA